MTNREWILEEMKSMSDKELGEILPIGRLDRNWCKQVCLGKSCSECKSKWLNQEHKELIKLSEVERVILENIDKRYKWIARDENDRIYVISGKKPKKHAGVWVSEDKYNGMTAFSELFKFIKWEDSEPYNIEELLK